MKLSKKKSEQLYSIIHEEIMQVRIKIDMNPSLTITTKEVDNLLSVLCHSALQKAIDLFKVMTSPK